MEKILETKLGKNPHVCFINRSYSVVSPLSIVSRFRVVVQPLILRMDYIDRIPIQLY